VGRHHDLEPLVVLAKLLGWQDAVNLTLLVRGGPWEDERDAGA